MRAGSTSPAVWPHGMKVLVADGCTVGTTNRVIHKRKPIAIGVVGASSASLSSLGIYVCVAPRRGDLSLLYR